MKQLLQIFAVFFKMGIFTIGGGIAMLPLIQHIVVDEKGWLNEDEMVDCVVVSQSLPGVIAINAATYIGKKKKGLPGAFAASIGVILPSFIIIIVAVVFLDKIGSNKYIEGAFTGIKASSCGLIAYVSFRLGKQVIKDRLGIFIAVLSFTLIVVFGISAIWPILLGGTIGFLFRRAK